jgi:hypothetical protein
LGAKVRDSYIDMPLGNFDHTKPPLLTRRLSASILFRSLFLSCVIGIQGVGKKNGDAGENQKRNKKHHGNIPILGGGNLGTSLCPTRETREP